MQSRFLTESELDGAVVALVPTIETNHCTRPQLVALALEYFADELGVKANVSAARVVASRVLLYWDGVKSSTKREVSA